MAAADKVQQMIQARKNAETYSIAEQWEETVAKKKDKICFHYLGDPENNFPPRALTFNNVDAIANQVTNDDDNSDHHSDFDNSAFVTMNDGDFDFAESYDHFSDGYDSF